MHDLDLSKGHSAARLFAWRWSHLRRGHLRGAGIQWLKELLSLFMYQQVSFVMETRNSLYRNKTPWLLELIELSAYRHTNTLI